MNQYRIILLDAQGAELSSGYLFAGEDESACASAERLMDSTAKAMSVEVTCEGRLVCSYQRAA